jgi:beta-glucosidase
MKRRLAIVGAAVFAVGLVTAPAPGSADTGCGAWQNPHLPADRRADLVLAQLTLDEKVSMTHTLSDATHSRETAPIPRLCVPALLLNNGPAGVASGGIVQPQATALPAPLAAAASFDPAIARAYGVVEGRETRDVGRNVMEGPNINIARTPLNGRTFEAYGEDPFLAGQIVVDNVRGIQSQGVVATAKHYLANNQENNRDNVNELIDDRTLHQIYMPAFEAAVKRGHTGSVMCAKNLVNNLYACEQQQLQQGVLKDAWGFPGFVMSDFASCHNTVRCATGGLDLELPSATFYGPALRAAVESGQVSMAALDDHVHRILATMFRFGLFDRSQAPRPIDVGAGGTTARIAAEAGTVLLKNAGNVLPLAERGSIALIGPSAATAMTNGGGSVAVAPLYSVSPLDAITKLVAGRATVNYAAGQGPVDLGPQPVFPTSAVTPELGTPGEHGWTGRYFANPTWSGDPVLTRTDPWVEMDPTGGIPAPGLPPNGWSIRWTGTFAAPTTGDYTFHLTNRARASLSIDGAKVDDNPGGFPGVTKSVTVHLVAGEAHAMRVDWAKPTVQAMIELAWTPPADLPNVDLAEAVAAAKKSDVAVVFAANKDTEAIDRTSLSLPGYQDQLIEAVAAVNPRTVVMLNTGGPVSMPWLDKVAGVVEAWYPGEEHGNAAAAVLFGDVDPSGRLPITFPRSLADLPTTTPAQYPGVNGVATYSEGLDVGYRHYDARDIEPLFPFGYGLSYTSFRLGELRVRGARDDDVTVRVEVANTGRRRGTQTVQVYVGGADGSGPIGSTGQLAPPRRLEGFAKVSLAPGERRTVTIPLNARAFAHWDSASQTWQVPRGDYQISVGTSSRDLPLSTRIHRDNATVS